MKITDQDVAWAAKFLKIETAPFATVISPEAIKICQQIIDQHSDHSFHQEMAIMLSESQIAEYEWRIAPTPINLSRSFDIDLAHIFQTLFAILGPVYHAFGEKLPFVTASDIEAVINDPAPVDLVKAALVRRYREYNSQWANLVAIQFGPLERIITKANIFTLSESFLRKLPEPLEKA